MATTDDLPPVPADPVVRRRRGPALIWTIPLVAALIGAWLVWQQLAARGPQITITFVDGSGLEAGKTKIRYRSIDVGTVDSVNLSADLHQVEVSATLKPAMKSHLGADSRFWVVRPRISVGGVSGLDTLLSGSYIEIEPGDGHESHTHFTGLEQAPPVRATTPGRSLHLAAVTLGSVSVGTRVLFRGIEAGEVIAVGPSKDFGAVDIEIFVRAPFDRLVRADSRFWRESAIDFSLGAQGVNLRLGSLSELIVGGIAFSAPDDPAPPPADKTFWLYDSYARSTDRDTGEPTTVVAYFDDSVRGLSVGAPVEYRGIRVGQVRDIRLELDPQTLRIRVPVVLDITPAQAAGGPVRYSEAERVAALAKLVERGLRVRLRSGSLLTGALFVDMDFVAEAPPARLEPAEPYPVMPTVPALTTELEQTLTELAAKLRRLPLDHIVEQLDGAASGANRLLNAGELRDSLKSLSTLLRDAKGLPTQLDRQIGQIGPQLTRTLSAGERALQQLDPQAPLASDLAATLDEVAAAARSLRDLADYLSRSPEALLRGKLPQETPRR